MIEKSKLTIKNLSKSFDKEVIKNISFEIFEGEMMQKEQGKLMKSVSTHLGMKCGLEIHVQLNTRSKIFCGCQNPVNGGLKMTKSFSTAVEDPKPNSLTCEICFGMPGSRPKLNKEVEGGLRRYDGKPNVA